ncbi:hypothetical protein SFRURICE_005057 [Spodoptera frugiperda]|nr:hypothetical protein SFRURICE_005057 [Spodoptera frugiperda]
MGDGLAVGHSLSVIVDLLVTLLVCCLIEIPKTDENSFLLRLRIVGAYSLAKKDIFGASDVICYVAMDAFGFYQAYSLVHIAWQ